MHRRRSISHRIHCKKDVRTSAESTAPVPTNIEGQQSVESGLGEKANDAELVLPKVSSSDIKRQLQTDDT